MSEEFKCTIDGKECTCRKGQTVTQAAADNGVYIPTLCDFDGIPPGGACRICTVKINGRHMAACTTKAMPGMQIENDTAELKELRTMLLEMLFVEGNHFCPACEKSGNCQLQALAYRHQMLAPRFKYLFTPRAVDADAPKLMLEHNRCILCKRCVRGLKTAEGKAIFSFINRGAKVDIAINHGLAALLTDAQAQEAMDICPVGAIIRKEKGFDIPIGKRTFDTKPIGSDIEKRAVAV